MKRLRVAEGMVIGQWSSQQPMWKVLGIERYSGEELVPCAVLHDDCAGEHQWRTQNSPMPSFWKVLPELRLLGICLIFFHIKV